MKGGTLGFFVRHKIITSILVLIILVIASAFIYIRVQMRGPHRDYAVDFTLPNPGQWDSVDSLEVGAAKVDVTPNLSAYDSWTDVDGNNRFDPEVDTYVDENGNGDFDLVWIGGFGNKRAAQGVNDPLWARAMAFRNNGVTIALVSIDSVGITHDRFITMRKMIAEKNPDIDHVVLAATHSHEAPDTIGIWSYGYLWDSRFDEGYMRQVQQGACDAVIEAVESLKPASALVTTAVVPKENFTRDSRDPQVVDNTLPLAWFRDAEDNSTIGILASWGMHPEAMGGGNPTLSSDFVHYFRDAIENGLQGPQGFTGFGGTCVYFSGPVGGLMTQLRIEITDRHGDVYQEDSPEKARAQGENLAIIGANALQSREAEEMTDERVAVSAKTIYVPIGWPMKAAIYLGMIHPGMYNGMAKTEVNAVRIGEIEIITTPGEIYPEIVFGGIESPEGADFQIEPVEVPPFFDIMQGKVKMNFNLANDEVGYLVPKSQWDVEPPYTYGRDSAPYGEEYVGNPEVTPMIYRESVDVLQRLHTSLETSPTAQ